MKIKNKILSIMVVLLLFSGTIFTDSVCYAIRYDNYISSRYSSSRYVYNAIVDVDKYRYISYNPSPSLNVKDQGDKNICVAEAISSLKTLQKFRATGSLKELDYQYVWDNGSKDSNGMFVMKTLQKLKKAKDKDYKITYVKKTKNIDLVKEGILNYYGVLVDTQYDRNFCSTGKSNILKVGGRKYGYHTMLITGWKKIAGKEYWVVQNSWGRNWGNKGICYMPFNYSNIKSYYITY